MPTVLSYVRSSTDLRPGRRVTREKGNQERFLKNKGASPPALARF